MNLNPIQTTQKKWSFPRVAEDGHLARVPSAGFAGGHWEPLPAHLAAANGGAIVGSSGEMVI